MLSNENLKLWDENKDLKRRLGDAETEAAAQREAREADRAYYEGEIAKLTNQAPDTPAKRQRKRTTKSDQTIAHLERMERGSLFGN